MTDFKDARETMVESQLQTAGVTDRGLLAMMSQVPRELFVSAQNRPLAYMDGDTPIGLASETPRYLMQPMALARLIQLAEIEPDARVLVVGAATGYSVAVLAGLSAFVVGLEVDPVLAEQAGKLLTELEVINSKIVVGPLKAGAAADGPYDVIILGGSVPAVPADLIGQLNEGGRIVGVISNENQGMANLFVKIDGEARGLPQFAVGARPLPGFAREPSFSF